MTDLPTTHDVVDEASVQTLLGEIHMDMAMLEADLAHAEREAAEAERQAAGTPGTIEAPLVAELLHMAAEVRSMARAEAAARLSAASDAAAAILRQS